MAAVVHFVSFVDLCIWTVLAPTTSNIVLELNVNGIGVWSMTCFIKNLGYVLVVLNLSVPDIISVDDSVMMSSCEPQCHHDIIMRTPRITG